MFCRVLLSYPLHFNVAFHASNFAPILSRAYVHAILIISRGRGSVVSELCHARLLPNHEA
jgi:hypothetical protein